MPSPVAVLRACGWLTTGAGLDRLDDLSSSHAVMRATRADGAVAVVKNRRPDGRRGISGELFVYRMVRWCPAIEGVIARPLHIDESRQILVLEAASGATMHGDALVEPHVMRRIGAALATIHVATLGKPVPPSYAAGVLEIADNPVGTGADRPHQTQALMRRIAGDALLAPALRAAKSGYNPQCLIHGDLRPEHWIAAPDGSLTLIDWEMGGFGDPMFDLASAMVEPALAAIRAGRPRRHWLTEATEAIDSLFAGYRDAAGSALLDAETAPAQIVNLGAARLIHVACEWSDTGIYDDAVDALIDAARDTLSHHHAATERLAV